MKKLVTVRRKTFWCAVLVVLPLALVATRQGIAGIAQIQDCICNEVGGGPPGFPPHPFMKPDTTFECLGGDLVATLVFNRPVANTVATRGAFPGFSSANTFGGGAACGPHQGLRLAPEGSPLGTGISPIGAVAANANTVVLTFDGTDAAVQALIAVLPACLQVSATYFAQPHLVDQGELLCIQTIDSKPACLETCCEPVEDPDVRTQGFWKRVCKKTHPSGEHENLPGYVDCVNDADTFEDVKNKNDLCDRLHPDPKNDKCEQAEAQFMALLLNLCSGRVAECNCVIDPDLGETTVGEAIDFIDFLLSDPKRTFKDCVLAQSIAAAINEGLTLVDCD